MANQLKQRGKHKAKTNGAAFQKGHTDGGYAGKFLDFSKQTWGVDFEVVERNELHKFVVLPKRWIVERTNSWTIRYRRLAKDFERSRRTVRNWIFLAMTRLMLRRLAKTSSAWISAFYFFVNFCNLSILLVMK